MEEIRGVEVCVKQEDQHQPLEVYYGPGSSLPPPPGFASTAMMGSNAPSTDTRDLASQREQDTENRRERHRVASREFRKREKATFEHLEASCKEKDRIIDEQSQKIQKLQTEIALMKDNQNEAMKILASGLQRVQDEDSG